MKQYHLGEFEEVVMLTVAVLYNNAYGVSIKKEIETRLDRSVSVGALQTALIRLEDKGYLKSREGEATEERAAGQKNIFKSPPSANVPWNTPGAHAMNYGVRFRRWL